MKDELIRYGVKKPIHVIPNFVEKDDKTKIQKNYLHKKVGLQSDIPIILSVGRLGQEKNFQFVIEAFHELVQTDKSSHLVVVGHGEDSNHLKKYAAELGLGQRVHFTGKINKKYMPSVYMDATLFVFASISEVHPLVTLEACAAGLPLIVAKDAAFDGVVVDNHNGYQLPLDKKIFAEKIHLLMEDKQLRKEMGRQSNKIIERNFPPEHLAEMLIDVYDTVLAVKPRTRTLQRLNSAAVRKLKQTTRFLDRIFKS